MLAGASPVLRQAIAAGALVALVALGATLAVGAAARPSFLVPFSLRDYPGWLGGPLAGLGPGLGGDSFSVLVLLMCGCYLATLACAGAVRPGWALGAILTLHLTFMLAPPLLSGDVFGYLAFSRIGAVHGLNPYLHGAASIPADPIHPYVKWPAMRSPYGPMFMLLSYPLAPLGVAAGLWACKALAAAASLGCIWLVWSCARRLGRPPVPAALFVGLNPLLLVYGVAGAHNDLLTMLLILAGVHLTVLGREPWGAAALVGAAAAKASSALLLPFAVLGVPRRRRALLGALAAAAAVGAVSLAVFGPDIARLAHVLGFQARIISFHSAPHYLGELLGLGGVTPGVRLAAGVAFASAMGLLLWRAWRGADWISCAGWATLALLITSSWLMPWYVVWVLPLAALGAERSLRVGALAFTAFLTVTRLPLLLG